jgi:FkbM family methyltransferase
MRATSITWLKSLVPVAVKRRRKARRDPEWAELARLRALPTGVRGTSTVLGVPLRYPDAWMFASTYEPIFRRRIYHFPARNSRPRILDCGANIGLASIYWARAFPEATITAFEPDPANTAFLRDNLAAAGATNVTVIEAAVWVSDGAIELSRTDADAGHVGSRIVEGESSGSDQAGISVPTVRLREYLSDPIDFLKLDIEGAETDVVLDIADLLPGVANMFVEYHGFAGRSRLTELLEPIQEAGFSVYPEQEHASPSFPFITRPDNNGMDVQLNLYCYRQTGASQNISAL